MQVPVEGMEREEGWTCTRFLIDWWRRVQLRLLIHLRLRTVAAAACGNLRDDFVDHMKNADWRTDERLSESDAIIVFWTVEGN